MKKFARKTELLSTTLTIVIKLKIEQLFIIKMSIFQIFHGYLEES